MTDNEKKSIGFYVNFLSRSARKYFDHEFLKHGLNKGSVFILRQLYYQDGMKQNELCGNMHLDKAAVTRTIEKLEDSGFVTRKVHPTDGRAKLVFLTEKARSFEKTFSEIFRNWTKILTTGFSKAEHNDLAEFMKRMGDNIIDHFRKEKLSAAKPRP